MSSVDEDLVSRLLHPVVVIRHSASGMPWPLPLPP